MLHHVIVLLWLGSGTSARPSALEQRALESWAQTHAVRLIEPSAAQAGLPPYDTELVRRIEALLDQAQLAADSLDLDRAARLVGQVDQWCASHPEIPQAAYLRAEVFRRRAALARERGDSVTADRWTAQADALEGPRARAFGDATTRDTTTGPDPSPAPVPLAEHEFSLDGALAGDVVHVDARQTLRVPATGVLTVRAPAGLHHVRVVRGDQVVYAAWLEVTAPDASALAGGAQRAPIHLGVPAPAPCSVSELTLAQFDGRSVVAPEHVRCPSWAVAHSASGGIRIARCHQQRCEKSVLWRPSVPAPLAGPVHDTHEPDWPVWASYVIAGVGVAAATTVTLWGAGAFDEPAPGRTRFVFDGLD